MQWKYGVLQVPKALPVAAPDTHWWANLGLEIEASVVCAARLGAKAVVSAPLVMAEAEA